MPPIDSAPHGAEILHSPAEPPYPEPKPGEGSDEPVRGQPTADGEPGARDEQEDPVTHTGQDIAG
jgi:hypothetical protein